MNSKQNWCWESCPTNEKQSRDQIWTGLISESNSELCIFPLFEITQPET